MLSIEKKEKKLIEKKLDILRKEKELAKKKKEAENRLIFEVGRLCKKAGLINLDRNCLMGSFLYIKEKLNDSRFKDEVMEKFNEYNSKNEKTYPVIVEIKEDCTETKVRLKNLNFKYNKFRNEWYGYGEKNNIEKYLDTNKVNLLVLDE
jgi:hypothetical protein